MLAPHAKPYSCPVGQDATGEFPRQNTVTASQVSARCLWCRVCGMPVAWSPDFSTDPWVHDFLSASCFC